MGLPFGFFHYEIAKGSSPNLIAKKNSKNPQKKSSPKQFYV